MSAPRCPPRSKVRCIAKAAPRRAASSPPMVWLRTSCTTRAAAGEFGGRNTAVRSRPHRAAQIANSSQFARWAENMRPGRPSSRKAATCSRPTIVTRPATSRSSRSPAIAPRCAYSVPVRPRFSQAPRTMASISSALLSGNAARALAMAMRCCRSHGPMRRAHQPPISLDASGPIERPMANSVRTRPTMPASAARAATVGYRIGFMESGVWAASERHQNLAEHVAGLQPLQPLRVIAEREHRVDHRRDPGGHLVERLGDVAHRAAERAEDAVLLLEQLHQVDGGRHARGRAAGDEPTALLERQERAVPGLGPDMLKHHVDALALGDLAGFALEALRAVVDDVIGSERARFLALPVVADRGDDCAADRFRNLDRRRADPGAARMAEDRLAGLQ